MSATLNAQHAPIERLALDSAGWPGVWAWPVGNRVGESPVWDAAEQALLWIDVRAPAVLRLHARGVHGVVCGHIHHAEMRSIDGVLYCNDGDWVESLTALVEHADGRLEIIDWVQHRRHADVLRSAGKAAQPDLAAWTPAG